MKISMNSLETKAVETGIVQQVSIGNQEIKAGMKVVPVTPFKAAEVSIKKSGDASIYNPQAFRFTEDSGWGSVDSLKQAFDMRTSGKKTLSFRECDILARSNIDISAGSSVEYFLMEMGCFMTEGVHGNSESGYELRARYNAGLKWIHEKKGSVIQQVMESAKERLLDIAGQLSSFGLNLWPEEVEHGFHADLLRPEWMTHTQYIECKKRPVRICEPIT